MAKATPCEIRLSPPVTSLCGDSSSHNKLSASVKHGTTYFRRISCAEQAAVGVRPHCTHCSETIFNSNVPELAVFFQNIIFHIYMGYFIAFLKYFTEGRVKNAHFSIFDPFSPGPTGIKGATDQMLPWKAPNDPKTLPMGILHDYKSCWTTLGPFGYPQGPKRAYLASNRP